jgi:hypothetical protein
MAGLRRRVRLADEIMPIADVSFFRSLKCNMYAL